MSMISLQRGEPVAFLCAQSPSNKCTLLHPLQTRPEVDNILHTSTETPTSEFHSRNAQPIIYMRKTSKEGGGLEFGWNFISSGAGWEALLNRSFGINWWESCQQ